MYVLKELSDEVGERCPQRKWHTHRHKDKGHCFQGNRGSSVELRHTYRERYGMSLEKWTKPCNKEL